MKKVYLIALLAALLAAFVSYLFVQNVNKNSKISDAHTTKVFVAFVDVEDGVTIDNDNFSKYFEVQEVVDNFLTPGYVDEKRKADVIGRVTTRRIVKGEQLSETAFSKKDSDKLDLSYTLYPGEVAISMPAPNTTGVDGYIRVGDTVDVIACLKLDTESVDELPDTEYNRFIIGNQKLLYARFVSYVVKDVEVIAIGSSEEHDAARKEGTGDLQTYESITLRVKEEDAPTLFRIMEFVEGQLAQNYTFVLKSREDSSKIIDENRNNAIDNSKNK